MSKDTLLRSVRAGVDGITTAPRVIGIDDWAWKKGHRYGTTVCDLERRQEMNAAVQALAAEGVARKAIVRRTGCSRQIVRRILRGEREDIFRIRQSSLEPWLPRLDAEWAGGCTNGAELWRRMRAAGFQGSLRVVTEWATRRRRSETSPDGRPRKCPSARAIARMMTLLRHHLTRDEALTVAQIELGVPRLAEAAALADDFQKMIRNRKPKLLDAWLSKAGQGLLSSFARGLRTDADAVVAAMEEPWSNGQAEGQINR
ncbi:MAG: ISL3 family transposase, partial [Pseudomonadota bacterium]